MQNGFAVKGFFCPMELVFNYSKMIYMAVIRPFIVFVVAIICACRLSVGQTYVRVSGDSVRVVNGELIIGNDTKDVNGALINLGQGVTAFQRLQLAILGDSAIAIVGQDTTKWSQNNSAQGKYCVLSNSIPITPYNFYYPTAFYTPLDSGQLYRVNALMYLKTSHAYDRTSSIRVKFSDTTLTENINVYNTRLDTVYQDDIYALTYTRLLRSTSSLDTLKLAFETDIQDLSGQMVIDSLSYVYVEKVVPSAFSYAYTVDTPDIAPLEQNQYFVKDSAIFNFTPVAQGISGWTDLDGDPSQSVLSETFGSISISTISTSLWKPNAEGHSATFYGENDQYINDFGGFWYGDSAVVRSSFVNANSTATASNYNLKIFGLDPNSKYQIEVLGSESGNDPNYSENAQRVKYVVSTNDDRDTVSHLFDSFHNTSKSIYFDTIAPTSEGVIFMSVGGADSTQSWANNGYISGIRIYELSKQSQSEERRSLHEYKQSQQLLLSDGITGRKTLIYYPMYYDSTKKYPILFYLAGNESWGDDYEVLRQFGVAMNIERGKDIYGIKANGDTVRFVTVVSQHPVNNYSFSAVQCYNLLVNLKQMASVLPIDTSQVYAIGFSSGGGAVIRLAYTYPYAIKAGVSMSPVYSGLTSAEIGDATRLSNNGVHLLLMPHSGETSLCNEVFDSCWADDPNIAAISQWYGRNHNGFNYQMDTAFRVPELTQTVYDFMVNPTKNINKYARFAFVASDFYSGWWDYGTTMVRGNPASGVVSATDSLTGITVSSISNGSWGGATAVSMDYDIYGAEFGYYARRSCWFTSSGSYAGNGNNLKISGLAANTDYEVIFFATVQPSYSPVRVSQFGVNGSGFKNLYCNGNVHNTVTIQGTTDANGDLYCSVYTASDYIGASQYGILGGLIVKKK